MGTEKFQFVGKSVNFSLFLYQIFRLLVNGRLLFTQIKITIFAEETWAQDTCIEMFYFWRQCFYSSSNFAKAIQFYTAAAFHGVLNVLI